MSNPVVAYFSMEIAIQPAVPTYSGGLGVLAGDHVRSAADAGIPLVAVTLLHAGGYFDQTLDDDGTQHEQRVEWPIDDHLTRLDQRVSVTLEGRTVHIGAWRYDVQGVKGHTASVIFLDTRDPENDEQDRFITDRLYQGDHRNRIMQEAVLGIGGVRMLEALAYRDVRRYHMNEGHAAFLAVEILMREAGRLRCAPTDPQALAAVRRHCVFTTHTPVPAGHDKFDRGLVASILEPALIDPLRGSPLIEQIITDGHVNMTLIGFDASRYINGVALRHREVSRRMFGGYEIDSITNGVHAGTWISDPMAELLDQHVRGWREDNLALRYAISIPVEEIQTAHRRAKKMLCRHINETTGAGFTLDRFTIGFGRRATAYKRPDLLLADAERLRKIAKDHAGLQIVFAGKAHPQDHAGADLIRQVVRGLRELHPDVHGVYLPNYDMRLCKLMVGGVDIWLNTPQPPLEASGTSGMKAALNGVPSLSTLDGWWVEGCVEGVTGWAIGPDGVGGGADPEHEGVSDRRWSDASALYAALDRVILPLYRADDGAWGKVMRHSIALNGAFFNTQRMLDQYVTKAYF